MLAIADRVDQEAGRSVDVRDHDVNVAVVIDVAKGHTAADIEPLERRAPFRRHVFEPSVPKIAEEELAFAVGKLLLAALLDGFDCPVRNEEVEPAVVVDIEPRSAKPGVAPAHGAEARRGTQIFEQPGSEVAVQTATFGR